MSSAANPPIVPPWATSLLTGGRRASSGTIPTASQDVGNASLISLPDLPKLKRPAAARRANTEPEDDALNAVPVDDVEDDDSWPFDAPWSPSPEPEPAHVVSDLVEPEQGQLQLTLTSLDSDPPGQTARQTSIIPRKNKLVHSRQMQALQAEWEEQHNPNEGRAAKKPTRRISISSSSSGSDIPAASAAVRHVESRPSSSAETSASAKRAAPATAVTGPATKRPRVTSNGDGMVTFHVNEQDLKDALNLERTSAVNIRSPVPSSPSDSDPAPPTPDKIATSGEAIWREERQKEALLMEERAKTMPGFRTVGPIRYHPSQLLEAVDGRLYTCLPGYSRFLKTARSVFPTGYKLYEDPYTPYICAVRDCQNLFATLISLGGHQGAKHGFSTFNDNLDGTMTYLGSFTGKFAGAPPIIVSRNPVGPNEPDPAMPSASMRVMKRIHEEKAKRWIAEHLPKEGVAGPGTHALDHRVKRRSKDHVPTDDDAHSPEPLPYLLSKLPPQATNWEKVLKSGPHSVLLKSLKVRDFLPDWTPMAVKGDMPNHAMVALLVYLTGRVSPNQCLHCKVGEASKLCVLPLVTLAKRTKTLLGVECAMCFYETTVSGDGHPQCSFHVVKFGGLLMVKPSPALPPVNSGLVPSKSPAFVGPQGRSVSHRDTPAPPAAAPARPVRAARAAAVRTRAATSEIINAGAVSTDMLEMEDWELAPGRIRDGGLGTAADENIAFSNSFLSSNSAVPISTDVGFNVVTLKPGGTFRLQEDPRSIRICSIAAGKLHVKLDQNEFQIGPNGVFKVRIGGTAAVENRLYVDSVLHISTIKEY